MMGRLDIRKWIQVYHPAYAVVQSGDGRYVCVGAESGAALFSLGGQRLAAYPPEGEELPVHRLCAPLDLTRLVIASRLGDVVYLDAKAADDGFEIEETASYSITSDIHTLALSMAQERVAIGHLSFALTMLDLEGEVVWQQQDREAAAFGSSWSIDLEPAGERLYAATGGSGSNWLVALDAASGGLQCSRECDSPVSAVAALPGGGVATLSPGAYYAVQLTVYDADLEDVLWETELDGPATALAADLIEPRLVVGAGYEGAITLFDAATGERLASEPIRSMVNGLSLVGGRFIAAATQDGNVVLLRYLP